MHTDTYTYVLEEKMENDDSTLQSAGCDPPPKSEINSLEPKQNRNFADYKFYTKKWHWFPFKIKANKITRLHHNLHKRKGISSETQHEI